MEPLARGQGKLPDVQAGDVLEGYNGPTRGSPGDIEGAAIVKNWTCMACHGSLTECVVVLKDMCPNCGFSNTQIVYPDTDWFQEGTYPNGALILSPAKRI